MTVIEPPRRPAPRRPHRRRKVVGPPPAGRRAAAAASTTASPPATRCPGGILLWTRVTPTADAQPGSGAGPDVEVAWQVAADPTSRGSAAGAVSTGAGRDHTVKVDVGGLSPATTYWYRFGSTAAGRRSAGR